MARHLQGRNPVRHGKECSFLLIYATISNKTSTSTTVGGSYSSLLGEAVIEYKGLLEKKKKTEGHFFSKWHLGLD